ncbi:hypothetical protein VE23_13825 [Paenibacillus sp. D9]|nr:hypothetical protein VE23_13825 [Paenibacillus sp. D9]
MDSFELRSKVQKKQWTDQVLPDDGHRVRREARCGWNGYSRRRMDTVYKCLSFKEAGLLPMPPERLRHADYPPLSADA